MLSWPIAFLVPFTEHTEYWRMGIGVRVEYVKISHLDNDEDDFLMLDDDWLERWYQNSGTVRGHNIFDDEGSAWANRLIWRVTRDTRNAFRFPSRGSILTLELEYVTEALGSYMLSMPKALFSVVLPFRSPTFSAAATKPSTPPILTLVTSSSSSTPKRSF